LVADVPDRPMRLSEIVPLAYAICDRLVAIASGMAKEAGQAIHCRKGCSACCRRFMLGLSPPEVLFLLEAMATMPPNLRQQASQRLEAATRSLQARGIPAALAQADDDRAARAILSDWWEDNRFDCPFLVDDSCAIYPIRSIVCREFASLSPPATCQASRTVPMAKAFSMIEVLNHLCVDLDVAGGATVVLPTMLLWAHRKKQIASHTWPGPQLVDGLFNALTQVASGAVGQPAG